jgi:hypothetical protein
MEGEDASGEVVSLPLVSEDLQPGSEMTPEDAQWSESTSFRLTEQPRISGTLETSGPDRSETGEQAPERSRSAPASESGRDRPTRETGQRETGQQEGAQPRPAQQESPVRGGTPR